MNNFDGDGEEGDASPIAAQAPDAFVCKFKENWRILLKSGFKTRKKRKNLEFSVQ